MSWHNLMGISIHSLRVEGDAVLRTAFFMSSVISIHSLRVEGDIKSTQTQLKDVISIHSLRVEGDPAHCCKRQVPHYFNPLPPCGGRPQQLSPLALSKVVISIHSLRVEGDTRTTTQSTCGLDFNPLPPCGGRQRCDARMLASGAISIHSLRVEGDCFRRCIRCDV
mgnify:CR=1 FL=1